MRKYNVTVHSARGAFQTFRELTAEQVIVEAVYATKCGNTVSVVSAADDYMSIFSTTPHYVIDAIHCMRNMKISAIKLLREHNRGLGLKEAKDFCEHLWSNS